MKAYLILLVGIIVSGCSSTGFKTANHNGLMYYFPKNCSQYKYSYSEPNELHCFHGGQITGQIIHPASQEQISNHRYQEAQKEKAWDDINRSLEKMAPKTTNTNCYNTFGGINCTSTTY